MKVKAATFDIGGVLYSDDAFKRGIEVGKNIAYKRSVEAIQDHQEAVEGWEVKDA